MTTQQKSYVVPMIIIGALFFIFGFVTWVNGSLIPYLKIACQLESDFQSYLVATAFFIAYTVMALPASFVLSKTGYKKGMCLGLLIMAVGAILFVPAARARDFNVFLLGLFIIGTGLALLQTASNPYVSIIGPIESAAKRISIMGICNKVAGILAGLIFGYIALKDADVLEQSLRLMDTAARDAKLDELSSRVIVPYIIIASVLVILALAILFSKLPDIEEEEQSASDGSKLSVDAEPVRGEYLPSVLIIAAFLSFILSIIFPWIESQLSLKMLSVKASLFFWGALAFILLFAAPVLTNVTRRVNSTTSTLKTSVLQFPHLLFGVAALFLYVGVEVMAGDTIISYGRSLGIGLNEARFYTQWTLAFMLIGYVIGIFTIPKYLSQEKALQVCAVLGIVFTLAAVVTNGKVSVAFIALLGLANSLMWPAIFPLAIDGLGRFTKIGSALLIMAIAGGAILPLIYGKLSEIAGTREAYSVMIPCYLFIFYFALNGHKAGKA